MDDILSLIFHGCNLASNLQSNLSNLTDQPNILLNSCEEIVRVFNQATVRLKAEHPSSLGESSRSRQPEFGIGTDEIEPLQLQSLAGMNPFRFSVSPESMMCMRQRPEFGFVIPAPSVVGGPEHIISTVEGEFQAMGVSDSGKRPLVEEPLVERPRKRDERRIAWAPVPSTENPEIPPYDGFVWRKYGRKATQGSRFPRSYYRCKAQGCKAKKNVQRLNDDQNTFKVTYYGDRHTCGTSVAAPLPSSGQRELVVATQPPPSSTSIQHINWSEFEARVEDTHVQHHGSTHTETSHVQAAREAESPAADLANLANFIFNSGSSSNSMDSIFPSTGDD